MTSPTPEPYRRSRFDPQDTLYQRCLGGAALAGALLLVAILLAPIRHTEITRVDQLSRRFARLILEPSAPRPLPSAMATLMPVKPGLAGVHSGDDRFGGTPVAPGAIGATHGTQPDAVIPGGGLRNRGPQPVGPGTGDAGRARAQATSA